MSPPMSLRCTCPSLYAGPCTCGRTPVSFVVHIADTDGGGRTLCDKPIPLRPQVEPDFIIICAECSREALRKPFCGTCGALEHELCRLAECGIDASCPRAL